MVAAGDDIDAADINELTPTWTAYTPTWGGASGAPSLGNGTLTGAYTRVGDLVHVAISLVAGSTTTFGSGRWTFSLPFAPFTGSVLPAIAIDDSATSRYGGSAWLTPGTGVFAIAPGAGGNGYSGTSPFTWAQNDSLLIGGSYRCS